jgi:hypothetical protein
MNILQQFFFSLFSFKRIAMFRFQGIGKTIGYVFFLMLLVTIPTGIIFGLDLNKAVKEIHYAVDKKLPDFTFEEASIVSEEKLPVFYEGEDLAIIFDASGELTPADLRRKKNSIAFLKYEAFLYYNGVERTFSYELLKNTAFSKADFVNFLAQLKSLLLIVIPVLFLILYLFSTALKFIGISFLAFVGLLIKVKFRDKLTYKHLWVLSAYAVTLPTILFTFLDVIHVTISFSVFLYWGCAIFVLYLIMKKTPVPKK